MNNAFVVSIFALVGSIASVSAFADNQRVEDALQKRADLSDFYRLLNSTGVNRELNENTAYTVFAPTNEAMARINQGYSCLYTPQCQAQAAQIVRNHIVASEIYIDDAVKQKGAIRSIGGRFVNVGEPARDDYTLDGHNVVYMSYLGGGMLYKVDGVIANPRELASIQYIGAAPDSAVTSVTEKTIADPACGSAGCPDAKTQTTTITHSVVGIPAPDLSPASR